MLIVIRINMRINMLRTHLKLNFVFKYRRMQKKNCACVLARMYESRKAGFPSCSELKLLKPVNKSTGDNHAEDELFQ